MSWTKVGDDASDYPKLMEVATLDGADDRSVNEVAGWFYAIAFWSAKHNSDYVVDLGTALLYGRSNATQIIKFAIAVNLVEYIEVDGRRKLKIVEDPDFVHIRLKADVEHDRQQNNDCRNPALVGPVRLRDGDNCRWCGTGVHWPGKPSKFKGTLDHLHPGEAGTVDTMIVSCMACNSARQGDETGTWDQYHQLLPAPETPRYGTATRKYLARYGYIPNPPAPDTPAGPSTASDTPQPGALAGGEVDPGVQAPERSGGASAGIPEDVDPGSADHAASAGPASGGPGVVRPVGLGRDSASRAPAIGESPGRVGTGRVGSGQVRSGGAGFGLAGSGPTASPAQGRGKRKRRRHR